MGHIANRKEKRQDGGQRSQGHPGGLMAGAHCHAVLAKQRVIGLHSCNGAWDGHCHALRKCAAGAVRSRDPSLRRVHVGLEVVGPGSCAGPIFGSRVIIGSRGRVG